MSSLFDKQATTELVMQLQAKAERLQKKVYQLGVGVMDLAGSRQRLREALEVCRVKALCRDDLDEAERIEAIIEGERE